MTTNEEIQYIQALLRQLLPTLSANAALAQQEQMSGKCSSSAVNVILQREHAAHALSHSKEVAHPDALLQAISPIMIDVETGLRDSPERDAAQAFQSLQALYRERGFVKQSMNYWTHPNAGQPTFPSLFH